MHDSLVLDRPLAELTVANAIATKFELLAPQTGTAIWSRFPHVKRHTLGAIYTEDGKLIETSVRSGGHGGDHVTSLDPEVVPDHQIVAALGARLEGRSIFLGPFMNHYGHFITESLSRCWLASAGLLEGFDRYVFYPFLFNSGEIILTDFHSHFFRRLGIPIDRIYILREPTSFESIVIPEPGWIINSTCNKHLSKLYSSLSLNVLRGADSQRLFLSRKPPYASRFKGASEVESIFQEFGFQVIYPEEFAISAQIFLYSSCDILAG